MTAQRFSSELKEQVVLEVVEKDRTIAEVSRLRPGGLRAELRNARSGGASCLRKAAAYFAREQK